MIHEIFPVGVLGCNCSIIGDEGSREALVIDPGDEIDRILSLLNKHELKLKQIIVTHAHIDHVGGATKLKQATGAPILLFLALVLLLGVYIPAPLESLLREAALLVEVKR